MEQVRRTIDAKLGTFTGKVNVPETREALQKALEEIASEVGAAGDGPHFEVEVNEDGSFTISGRTPWGRHLMQCVEVE